MKKTTLVITSIADASHPVLRLFAAEAHRRGVRFIVIGDTKSPSDFHIDGCEHYSIARQMELGELARMLPTRHYARKNLGYLEAIRAGAEIIIESDDDNIPFEGFWTDRTMAAPARPVAASGWVNVYRYFTDRLVWPRGFSLEHIHDALPPAAALQAVTCPIQQGLVDDNPDVDAIFRLTLPLPFRFAAADSVALGAGSVCPFNSQNTTWFRDAFPLLYLPSHCSFRMTDIWRSFIAQRIAWNCGWSVLFHASTARQERNDHRLLKDFEDEIPGYLQNAAIVKMLAALDLKDGPENLLDNLERCYMALVRGGFIGADELPLVRAWSRELS